MKRTDEQVDCKLVEFGCAAARLAAVALLALAAPGGLAAGFVTSVKPYARTLSPDYQVKPLLSVSDRVPHTSLAGRQFQMIGVPDGLGA